MKLRNKVIPLALAAALPMMMASGNASAGPDPFMGEINYVGFNFAPRNWSKCDGGILSISSNTALFSLLGTSFGGNGTTTFGLPDMRGRVPVHQGQGPGLSTYVIGHQGGYEGVQLSLSTLPTHTHVATVENTTVTGSAATSSLMGSGTTVSAGGPSGNSLGTASGLNKYYATDAPTVAMHAGSVTTTISSLDLEVDISNANTGSGQSHENRMPYTVLNCVIALQGTYPSRN